MLHRSLSGPQVSQKYATLKLVSVFTWLAKDIKLPDSIVVFTMNTEDGWGKTRLRSWYGFRLHQVCLIIPWIWKVEKSKMIPCSTKEGKLPFLLQYARQSLTYFRGQLPPQFQMYVVTIPSRDKLPIGRFVEKRSILLNRAAPSFINPFESWD